MKEPVNHTLHCWPISREGEGREDLRLSVCEERHSVERVGDRGGGERETDEENDREKESQRGRVAVTELPCPVCK